MECHRRKMIGIHVRRCRRDDRIKLLLAAVHESGADPGRVKTVFTRPGPTTDLDREGARTASQSAQGRVLCGLHKLGGDFPKRSMIPLWSDAGSTQWVPRLGCYAKMLGTRRQIRG